jgi:hypothetical protein
MFPHHEQSIFHLDFHFLPSIGTIDITIELRALGVPWTLHCWMNALAAGHELRLDTVIDQLLQDFLQVCPDDYSQQFVMECLPLLFSIFRYSKVCVSNNFICVSSFGVLSLFVPSVHSICFIQQFFMRGTHKSDT